MVINLEILENYFNKGLLYKQRHPYHNLLIWNYTPYVQFGKLWDDITIQCRGLVTDFEGNVVSWCFKKFFNMEEHTDEEIPKEPFEVFEKMDGSYVSIFRYNDELIFTSRGSFNSDVSNIAEKVFMSKYMNNTSIKFDVTYILELIGPDNRIVLDYPENDLVLIGAFSKTGDELDIYSDDFNGFNRVKKYDSVSDYRTLKEHISKDKEGYVIRFKSGFRMKIKGEEYFRLHSVITEMSNRVIWRHLMENKPIDDLLYNVPDEFYSWVKEQTDNFNDMFDVIKQRLYFLYYTNINEDMTQKEVAEIINKMNIPKDVRSMLFCVHNGRDFDKIIWKHMYPKYSRPYFKVNKNEI